jgi:putative ABC transport system substrate-binding protein
MFKKILIGVLSIICAAQLMAEDSNRETIAITQIVEHPALDATKLGIIDELKKNDFIDNKNIRIEFASAQGNPTLATQIAQKFVGEEPAAIVAIGTTSAQAFVSLTKARSIPVIFSSITDPIGAKLVNDLKKPGSNFTGASNLVSAEPQLISFKEILPKLKTLGIVYNPGEVNSVKMIEVTTKAAKKMGIEVLTSPANKSSDIPQATEALIGKVDAIFVNNDNTALSAFKTIVKIATTANIPVFVSDTDMVEQGAIAALGPNQYELGRQTGKMLIKVLKGAKPSELPVEFPTKVELVLNQTQAKLLSIKFEDKLIKKAAKVIK